MTKTPVKVAAMSRAADAAVRMREKHRRSHALEPARAPDGEEGGTVPGNLAATMADAVGVTLGL